MNSPQTFQKFIINEHSHERTIVRWIRAACSNKSLEVFCTTNNTSCCRCGELHTCLAECILRSEVVGCIAVDRNDSLTSSNTGSRSDVLSESTSHTLGNTVSTSTGRLLVFSQDVVRIGVDTQSISLCTSFLTDCGVGNNTGCFKSSVSNLTVVVST